MAKVPWRFQAEIAYGDTDPVVTVFMGDVETDDETGVTSIRQDTRFPIQMKLSDVAAALDLADSGKMGAIADQQKAARIASRSAVVTAISTGIKV